MKLCEASKWQEWVDTNKDPYGKACVTYAERWADLMEERMAAGQTLAECAGETSHQADVEGITGFMYGAAVAILSTSWYHGPELKRWHNVEYGVPDAQGVVNPAILVIGDD